MGFVTIWVVLMTVLRCDGVSVWDQLVHIANRQNEDNPSGSPLIMRRFGFGEEPSTILGAPSFPSHLPPSEPILPGHTLIRPSIGMLKSAVKFPHRDLENGAGVYGHIDEFGIRYGGTHDRVLYSGFRRMGDPTRLTQPTVEKQKRYFAPFYHDSFVKKRRGKDRLLKKMLTIFPAIPIHIEKELPNDLLKKDSSIPLAFHPQEGYKKPKKQKKVRLYKVRTKPRYDLHAREAKASTEETDLKDLLRIIKSLRRDQDLRREEPHVGRNGLGNIIITQIPEQEVDSKAKLFWETKDLFNHITINPDAPELDELLPAEAWNDTSQPSWWFYHQSDFEEFENQSE